MIKRLSRKGGRRPMEEVEEAPDVPDALDESDDDEEQEEEEDDDDEADEDDDGNGAGGASSSSSKLPAYPSVIKRSTHKKKKILVLCSRGVTSHYMELMEDIMKLLPHCRKDPKFDKKEPLTSIVEIAELGGCALALYFEVRKMKDLYLWAGRVEGGPSVKFLVQQVRPMRDLRLTGNCLLGSRPILSFDGAFDASPELTIMKHVLSDVFAPPKGHPRSKPFHDHVLNFSILEGRILLRHYQLVQSTDGKAAAPRSEAQMEAERKVAGDKGGKGGKAPVLVPGYGETLVEIGPRFALVPIRILAGCFRGETLFSSETFVSPNVKRAEQKKRKAKTTIGAVAQKEKRRKRIKDGYDELPDDDLEDVFRD